MVTEINPNNTVSKNSANSPIKSNLLSNDFDFERIFHIIIRKWPLIILFTILSYMTALLYLRYATPKYSAITRILIKDTKSSAGISEAAMFQDLGILNTGRNLDNEIEILKTSFLMQEVVRKLNLQYAYRSEGRLISKDLYNESPVVVLAWEPFKGFESKTFGIGVTILENKNLKLEIDEKVMVGSFGQGIKTPFGMLTLGSPEYRSKVSDLKFINIIIRSIQNASYIYSSNLSVVVDAKTRSTVLQLTFNDVNEERAMDVLRETINVYNEFEVADKNRVYKNTVEFIDQRMALLGDELRTVEGDVASFRSQNSALNLAGEGAMLLTESSTSIRQIAEVEASLGIIGSIKEQLSKMGDQFNIVPTSESLTTPTLASLLTTFNQLTLERERQLKRFGPKHPEIEIIENQLANLRVNILENIKNVERDLLVKRDYMEAERKQISGRIKTLPNTEKQLLEIQRQQLIKQELYLYLLQKREEAALSQSVTVANNRIIEPPKFNGQVAPKAKLIKLFSISIGIFIPIVLILFLQAINRKIMTEEQIKKNCSVPILGTIPFTEVSSATNAIVVNEGKRSATAEMFRLIRANLQFVGEGVHNKVLLFTSSVSGEGKSFNSINLGITLSLAKKRVILVELDMRKPKLSKYLALNAGSKKGVTDFLVNDKVTLSEITREIDNYPNIFWIPCGNLPPNPSELLIGERIQELFSQLRNSYDYILVDAPPVGLVSDALLLNKIVDASIFVVRQGVTEVRQLKILDDIVENEKLPRPYIIFNGVKFGKGGYGYDSSYGYGYGYNYGYGYGYYSDDKKKKTFWKRLTGAKA